MARTLFAVAMGSSALVGRVLRGVDALQVPEHVGAVRLVTRRFVRAAHAAGVEVHVWTVNERVDMDRLLAIGVDGLVTDRTDLATAAVAAHRARNRA